MPRAADPTLRQRLIDAATVEFVASGYAGARLDAIAEGAGVTKGGIYFHFAGKEDLFFAVLDHWRERRRRSLQVPAAGSRGAAAALRGFLRAYLAFHLRAPEATRLMRVLNTELREKFTARLRADEREEHRWVRARLRDLLVEGIGDGTLFCDDPPAAAFLLASELAGVLAQWHAAPGDVEAWCHEEELARALAARYATGRGSMDRAGRRRADDHRDRPE